MIWPEFENADGEIILENNKPVPVQGTARMWIINAKGRPIHQKKIQIGTQCHFWEGRWTADCEVIDILALHTNPFK
jgi:hypothetical protein